VNALLWPCPGQGRWEFVGGCFFLAKGLYRAVALAVLWGDGDGWKGGQGRGGGALVRQVLQRKGGSRQRGGGRGTGGEQGRGCRLRRWLLLLGSEGRWCGGENSSSVWGRG
jgi:hypothetical protein